MAKRQPPITTADDFIDALGGTNETASIFGTSAAAISKWRRDGIPKARQSEVLEAARIRGIRIDAMKLLGLEAA